jgi:hypothetical protein
MSLKKYLVALLISAGFFLIFYGYIFYFEGLDPLHIMTQKIELDSSHIMMTLSHKTGKISCYKEKGEYYFIESDKIVLYPKSSEDTLTTLMRFNDGVLDSVKLRILWRMPTDSSQLSIIFLKYGSIERINSLLSDQIKNCFLTVSIFMSLVNYKKDKNFFIRRFWINLQKEYSKV